MAQPENKQQKQMSGLQRRVDKLVSHPKFTGFITALILLNALTLGLAANSGLEVRNGSFLSNIDNIVIGLFVIELALKIFAWRGSFFRSGWNNFDFIIVAVSLFPAHGPFAIIRTFRIFRVLRLISVVPRMRYVIDALLKAIPGMTSVLAVLLVIFYVGSVLTTELFGQHPSTEMQEMFGSIPDSMYSLFQLITLENWPDMADATMQYYPLAWSFFVPFIIIASFAVLNLFIGIIVDAMNLVNEEDLEEEKMEARADALLIQQEISALRAEIKILTDKLS